MQEKKAPVFIGLTANSIHMLPPELLRKIKDMLSAGPLIEALRTDKEHRGQRPECAAESRLCPGEEESGEGCACLDKGSTNLREE